LTWSKHIETRIKRRFAPEERFTIEDLYKLEEEMARLYPENRHIRETIRDVVQDLRDDGTLDFVDNQGTYRWHAVSSGE
jgi:hypothetical protein